MFELILLYVHAFATWMMIGLIFFVQIVYFPLYKRLKEKFKIYDKGDIKHMGLLVAPVFFLSFFQLLFLLFMHMVMLPTEFFLS